MSSKMKKKISDMSYGVRF